MPFTQTRFVGPTTLTTSAASALYMVATGYSAVIKQIVVTNTTASARTFTIYVGAAASASTAIFSGTQVAANDSVVINTSQVLNAGDKIFALADAGSAVNLTISGVVNDGPLSPNSTYLADNQVTTNKIAANAVTQAKLASTLSGTTITTSANRSTDIPSPFAGQTIYETDTNRMYVWNGTAWVIPNQTTQNPEGFEFLASASLNATSSTPTSLSNVFSATYDSYRLVCNFSTAPQNLYIRLRTASDDSSAVYQHARFYARIDGGASGIGTSAVADTKYIAAAMNNGYPAATSFDIHGPYLARYTALSSTPYSEFGTTTTNSYVGWSSCLIATTTQYTGISLFPNTATLLGEIRLYGYRNS